MKLPPNVQEVQDGIVSAVYSRARQIADDCVHKSRRDWDDPLHYVDSRLDDILTSRLFGFPIMIALLGAVLWITVVGANYPSQVLATVLFWGERKLTQLFISVGAPPWLHGSLVLGGYRTLAWVVSVMLPPMAIFFPLFTLLEDLGYLARVTFNLDWFFKKSGAHGKQALTMAMGFGCNAAGVMACRIIDSPRERLIAIITNNFAVCNGRFPTLIALASFIAAGVARPGVGNSVAALIVVAMVILGVCVTFMVSWLLSRSLLRGVPSSFILELPPYRRPDVPAVLARSLYERTVLVLKRAVIVAAPAGVVVWILGNTTVGGRSIIAHMSGFLQPAAGLMGLDGAILAAFILGLPANEIVLPILLMSYLSERSLVDIVDLRSLFGVLAAHGWTWLTAMSTMVFAVLHYPCSTTLLTIAKETKSVRWTVLAAMIPTAVAVFACALLTLIVRHLL